MYAQRLAEVLPLVDWVGLDVKAPFADYARITGAAGSGERALAGLQQVLASGVDHEIRTTVHPALLGDTAVIGLAHDLADLGVKRYVIQAFRRQESQSDSLRLSVTRERPLQTVGEQKTKQNKEDQKR